MTTISYDPANDYYAILGVSTSVSSEELKKAYRSLARLFHPDTNADPQAEKRFKLISEAYVTLQNSDSRFIYDQLRESSAVLRPPVLRVNTKLIDFGTVSYGLPLPEKFVLFDNDGGDGVFSTIPEAGRFWHVSGEDAGGEAMGKFVFSLVIDGETEPGRYEEYVQIQIDNDEGVSAVRVLIKVTVEESKLKSSSGRPVPMPDIPSARRGHYAVIPYLAKLGVKSRLLVTCLIVIALIALVSHSGTKSSATTASSIQGPSPTIDMTVTPVNLAKYRQPIVPFEVVASTSKGVQDYLPVYAQPASNSQLVRKIYAGQSLTLLCVTLGETLRKSYAIPLDGVRDYSSLFWYKTQKPDGYISRLTLFASYTFKGVEDRQMVDCDTGITYQSFQSDAHLYPNLKSDAELARLNRYPFIQEPNIDNETTLVLPVCKGIFDPNSTSGSSGAVMVRLKSPDGWVRYDDFSLDEFVNTMPSC